VEHEVSTNPKVRITPEEYLALERKAEIKSEYIDGEMFAMSGAQREHNTIMVNLATELGVQLMDRPCEVYVADMRTKVSKTGLYTYPDAVVVCGEPEFEDAQLDTLINPQIIIEILSKSTESYDRGKKFAHYRTLDSLQEYLLVSQTECRIERYARQDDGNWLYSETTDPGGSIELAAIACRLSMSRLYHKIDFELKKELGDRLRIP
jgi:Uma2 family endonuclease